MKSKLLFAAALLACALTWTGWVVAQPSGDPLMEGFRLVEVASVAEQGYPGYESTQWYGLNAPAKVPAAIIKRLADEAAKAAKQPSVAERFALDDAEAVGSTPAEYAAFIAAEQKRWGEVVRRANIKAN